MLGWLWWLIVNRDSAVKNAVEGCQDLNDLCAQVLKETDPSTVTEHGLYERPVDKMPDDVLSSKMLYHPCHDAQLAIRRVRRH